MTDEAHQPSIPIVTTFDPPPGWRIHSILGPCWGITVRSRSIGGQIVAEHRRWAVARSPCTPSMPPSRNQALQRLEEHAIELGANMVLAMRFDSSDLLANTSEIIADGTAVFVVEEEGPRIPAV